MIDGWKGRNGSLCVPFWRRGSVDHFTSIRGLMYYVLVPSPSADWGFGRIVAFLSTQKEFLVVRGPSGWTLERGRETSQARTSSRDRGSQPACIMAPR